MQRHFCQCGQETFFGNLQCSRCGTELGFDPASQRQFSISADPNNPDQWIEYNKPEGPRYKICSHREHDIQCNWLVSIDDDYDQCLSCRLTRTIPMLDQPNNMQRWVALEGAKRRMLYGLLRLGLIITNRFDNPTHGLLFDFLEDKRTNPNILDETIYTGHDSGVITLNVAEADPSLREAARVAMNEPYRTLVGHFRHEIGHYFWEILIHNTTNHVAFRELFGNEDEDYQQALEQHYDNGPRENWAEHHISAYASSHPHEDWAETWAHYLLMSDAVEIAVAFNIIPTVDQGQYFDQWLTEWMELSIVLNALNRSTGHYDAYPFVLSEKVREKLKFIHDVVVSADFTTDTFALHASQSVQSTKSLSGGISRNA